MAFWALLVILVYVLYAFKFNNEAYQIDKRETINSLVINVDLNPITFANRNGYLCQVKLPDDSLIELMVTSGRIPNVGDKLPLLLEHYKDGKKVYTLNHRKWERF